jgi:hypothetical protein
MRSAVGVVWAAALGVALAACATPAPVRVAGPPANPFAVNEAIDAPRVGPAAAGTRPAAPDGYPFGRDEAPMQAAGREILTGQADGAAYLYTADHRIGLMAGQPGRGARTLSYSGRDWYVTCAPGAGCVVTVATAEVEGRPIQDAVRLLVDPTGSEPVRVCLGPEGTRDGTFRLVNLRRDFAAGSDGCLRSGDAEQALRAVLAGEDFQFRYTDASGADVRGGHTPYGLNQALALARWLGVRAAAA